MLQFAHCWKVRCLKCGHRGEIAAATSELAAKPLRCSRCDHLQSFAPETVRALKRTTRRRRVMRRPNGKRASHFPTTPDLNDRLDDLWARAEH
jgi:hypothetical protein